MVKSTKPKQEPLGCYHFNIKWQGDIVFNRVNAAYFRTLRPEIITWAWCVNVRRELTREEIKRLCATTKI